MLLSIPHASVPPQECLSTGRALTQSLQGDGKGCDKIPSVFWMGVMAVGNLTGKMLHRKLLLGTSQPLQEQKVKAKRGTFFTWSP